MLTREELFDLFGEDWEEYVVNFEEEEEGNGYLID